VVAVIRLLACCFVAGLACVGPLASAADLPLLQTSEFQPGGESAAAAGSADSQIDLSLTLKEMAATADGPRLEGSASIIREWKITDPKSVTLPEIEVTIVGHIVKTPPSVARLDVQIGDIKRSFVWARDEVKSGTYEFKFSEPMPDGKVPSVLPVSAFALVTREPSSNAVLVTIDSIKVKISSSRVAGDANAIQGEVTGTWPDLAP
jgi:hypothetical protein